MEWKFWRKKETSGIPSGSKTKKLEKPIDLPQEVGRHLVVDHGLDPDWAWSLKCVRKPRENSKSTFDIRIFSSETMVKHGVRAKDYDSLDNHMDLVLFVGWYDKTNQSIKLERMIKEAV